ncbi:hypothetical protein C8F01DRAFT_1184902 [Mycena amicta]|nr:hypothetical protein C8F01DRAFT_1184902 [Mycena amicta]
MTLDQPILPLELEREIFLLTAEIHEGMRPVLLRVAQRVRTWIEPILYHTLQLDFLMTGQMAAVIARTKAQPIAAGFFLKTTVRHVIVDPLFCTDIEGLIQALKLCTGTTHFAFFGDWASLLTVLASMPNLTHLGAFLRSLPVIHPADPVWQNLTHLELFDKDIPAAELARFPALTHLAIRILFTNGWLDIEYLLSHCQKLEVLVACFANHAGGFLTVPVRDIRFVATPSPLRWDESALCGETIWTLADAFVRKKRLGQIAETCFLMEREGL